jgi:hypothetical protein
LLKAAPNRGTLCTALLRRRIGAGITTTAIVSKPTRAGKREPARETSWWSVLRTSTRVAQRGLGVPAPLGMAAVVSPCSAISSAREPPGATFLRKKRLLRVRHQQRYTRVEAGGDGKHSWSRAGGEGGLILDGICKSQVFDPQKNAGGRFLSVTDHELGGYSFHENCGNGALRLFV